MLEIGIELFATPSCGSLSCICYRGVDQKSLTTSKAVVCGQLECVLWAVPPLPRELVFALLHSTLCANLHTAGVGQKSLGEKAKYIICYCINFIKSILEKLLIYSMRFFSQEGVLRTQKMTRIYLPWVQS